MQLIVFGMHRSGTSMVTRLINLMGAYFASENQSLGYAPDNPKGFWERRDALALNDALLAHNGCRWDRVAAWPFNGPRDLPEPLRHRLKSLVLELDAHRPWVLKDPRLCLTFPYWRPYLEVPVAVVAHRDPLEVARSLQMRDGLAPEYALGLWEYYAVGTLNATRALPRIHLDTAQFLADPVGATEKLFMALERLEVRGLHLPSAREITGFIDPALHRAKKEAVEASLSLSVHQQALRAALSGTQHMMADVEPSEETRAILQRATAS